jgi:hypothetical protein
MGDKLNVDMDWLKFAKILIESQDLDPVYTMLVDSKMEERLLHKFLLAYWCYYDCGVAAYIAESRDFYMAMWRCFVNAPRGMERRHFRGQAACDAIEGFNNMDPQRIVKDMCAHKTFAQVSAHVQRYKGFGPWIAWKIGDMSERILGWPVDFNNTELGIYKDPVKGAAFIRFNDKNHPITHNELAGVVDEICHQLNMLGYKAPPWGDRDINIQEAETILCKYKAHCFGHYPLGNDSLHVLHCLDGWGDLATELKQYVPDWRDYEKRMRV